MFIRKKKKRETQTQNPTHHKTKEKKYHLLTNPSLLSNSAYTFGPNISKFTKHLTCFHCFLDKVPVLHRIIMHTWKWPSYLPQISLKLKCEKLHKTWGGQNKNSSNLKLVIRPKRRHILLTFDQEDLLLAENVLASLKWKDSYFFSCLYRKITHPSQ